MQDARRRSRWVAFRHITAIAFAAGLWTAPPAFAQSAHTVRVTHDSTAVRRNQHTGSDIVMTASQGTLLEVIHTEGDRFQHRKDNWYWVLLPRDTWGTQRAGWISGREVEEVSRPNPADQHRTTAMLGDLPSAEAVMSGRRPDPSLAEAAANKPAESSPPAEEALSDVVLKFEFAKSELTDDAKRTLADAVSHLTTETRVSLAVEGHADAIGSEAFNKRLGLERAEAVKRFLADHRVPAEQIGVISYGESQPAASNATEDGRAENRRVVIRVGR